jgi:hypothetical protein
MDYQWHDLAMTGMPVLALLYPSPTLAEIGDTLTLLREMSERRSVQNADDLVAMVRTRLQRLLEGTIEDAASDGPDDDAWYWAAPILLDLERAPHTRNWWTRKDLSLQRRGWTRTKRKTTVVGKNM